MLNVLDEFTHECLAIRVARKLKAIDVIDVLSDLFIVRGVPGHLSSSPRPSKLGSPLSAPRLPISSGAVLGRTATSRASTRACAISCSMARSSTPSKKLRSSSKVGGDINVQDA